MSAAYVDTSYLVAIVFGEPQAAALRRRLRRFDRLLAGDLLRAEALSVAARERIDTQALAPALGAVSLVLPDRSLEGEMREVLSHGSLRGADLWHIACAMFVAGNARAELAFLSRDASQRKIAGRLGFMTP